MDSEQQVDLLERVNDGIVAFDAEMNYIYVNPRGAEMLARKPADLIGRNYWAEFPEAKDTPFAKAYIRALETQETLVIEDYYEPWDRWFENRIHPSQDGLTIFFTEITERKRAEKALRDSERRFRALFEQSNDAVFLLDLEGRHLAANQRAADMFGYTLEEILQLGADDLTAEPAESRKILERLLGGEHIPLYERNFQKKNSEIVPVEINLELVLNGEGAPMHIQSVVRDITERKRTETRLRESREQLALAVRSANVGLWDWDLLTNKVYYSPEWKSQLGYEDHELSNDFSEWEIRVHPEDLERAKATVSGYVENPYPNFQNEFRMRHRDGSYRWILAQASLTYDAQGKPIRMIGSHIDITERKHVEGEIRRERDFSKAALDSLPGVFYMYDRDGNFLRWNRNFEQVTGYTGKEIAAMHPLDFFEGEEKELLAGRIQEVFERGESSVEADFVSKDGTRAPYYFTGRTIQVEGKPCLIGVGIDIAERKRAEEALQRNAQVLRLFVEHSPAAIAMFDREMRYIVASRRYLIDYELGEQNLIGRSHYEVFPEIPERWKEIHRRCLAGAVERAEQDPFPRNDGRLDWVRWEIRPWYETNGEIGGIILFSEVITERKQARDELRLSRDRLADLSRRLVEAHESERRAIGRELHDQFGQMLTALKLTIETAMQLPSEEALKKAAQGKELVEDMLARVSALSLELRPPMLDDLGLLPALLWHVNRFQEQSGIVVDFKHSGVEGVRFASEIETTAYRVAQESLTNVARHARANRVRLEVRKRGAWMEIEIADDGVGFDPKSALAKNRGLSGIHERVQLVGGTFHIESEKGKGTQKLIRLPLREEQE